MKTKLETEHKVTIDGKIEIVRVDGMSRDEIKNKYGAEVLRVYKQGAHTVMEYKDDKTSALRVTDGTGVEYTLTDGVMEKARYESIDALLRESAVRLREIVERVKNNTTIHKTTY